MLVTSEKKLSFLILFIYIFEVVQSTILVNLIFFFEERILCV